MRNPTTFPTPKTHNFQITADSFQDLSDKFDEELKRRHWAEKTLLELLQSLEKNVTSYELTLAIQSHARVTEHQIDRLLHVFDELGERALTSKDEAIAELFENAEAAANAKAGFERDEAITIACRRIMQYEILVYEDLLKIATTLKLEVAANHISKAINEERQANAVFNQIELKSIYSA